MDLGGERKQKKRRQESTRGCVALLMGMDMSKQIVEG